MQEALLKHLAVKGFTYSSAQQICCSYGFCVSTINTQLQSGQNGTCKRLRARGWKVNSGEAYTTALLCMFTVQEYLNIIQNRKAKRKGLGLWQYWHWSVWDTQFLLGFTAGLSDLCCGEANAQHWWNSGHLNLSAKDVFYKAFPGTWEGQAFTAPMDSGCTSSLWSLMLSIPWNVWNLCIMLWIKLVWFFVFGDIFVLKQKQLPKMHQVLCVNFWFSESKIHTYKLEQLTDWWLEAPKIALNLVSVLLAV